MTLRVLVSGGTGYVGRFIVEGLQQRGFRVSVAGRTPPKAGTFSEPVSFRQFSLGQAAAPDLFEGIGVFVHAAFDHIPGRYRGGEGNDAAGFRRRNVEGSKRLFAAAKSAGVSTAIFLSTRAVYGSQPRGATLSEDTVPNPDTLYGRVKLEAERDLLALQSPTFRPIVLRVTGVYGQSAVGADHKWAGLLADYFSGKPIEPRGATEVHGQDVSSALHCVLDDSEASGVFNLSDLVLDRHDLLQIVSDISSTTQPIPPRADKNPVNVMATERLRSLGWTPGGMPLLRESVRRMLYDIGELRT